MTAYADRVFFTASSGSSGTFVEGSAITGYQTMESAAAVSGSTYRYAAQSTDLSQWEYGQTVWTSSNKNLTRIPFGNNLNSTVAISFTNAPQVMISILAEDLTNISYLNIADQLLSGGANVTSFSLSTGNFTVDCGKCPLQYISNTGAFTITASTLDGTALILITNSTSPGAVSFSGYSVGSNAGDALDTSSGHLFTVYNWRINGTAGYRIAAHQ